jgi:hypothetical protein
MSAKIIEINPEGGTEYAAVFRERSDGDWDFVACFCMAPAISPMLSQATPNPERYLLDLLAEAIADEGEKALIVWTSEPDLPMVYEYEVQP